MSARATGLSGRTWVALDLDGVVYQGAEAVPGSVEAVTELREAGLQKIREGMTTVEEVLRVTTGH